jgi:hypothetical protein
LAQTAATGAASARAGLPTTIGEISEEMTRQSAIPPLRTHEPMPLD